MAEGEQMHTGNIDIETVKAAEEVARFIGDRDYTALNVQRNGNLEIAVSLRGWEVPIVLPGV